MKETPRAKQAFNDYVALGADRSLEKLLAVYETATKAPPTRRIESLKAWSRTFGWQARLAEIAETERQAIVKRGIADKQNRIDAYNERWGLMRQVIHERAEHHPRVGGDGENEAAGAGTGLMVLTVRFLPSGGRVEEWAVDTALLKEMRETEKQAAQELGQWVEKIAPTDPSGQRPFAGLTDEEIDRQLENIAKKAGG